MLMDDGEAIALVPGERLGPFHIGMDLGAALKLALSLDDQTTILFDKHDFCFTSDIVIDLNEFGCRLCFDGLSQKLQVAIAYFNQSFLNQSQVLPSAIHSSSASRLISPQTKSQSHISTSLLLDQIGSQRNEIPRRFSLRGQLLPPCSANDQGPTLLDIYQVCGPSIPGSYTIIDASSVAVPDTNTPATFVNCPNNRTIEQKTDTIVNSSSLAPGKGAGVVKNVPTNQLTGGVSCPTAASSASITATTNTDHKEKQYFYNLKYPGLFFRFPIPSEDYNMLMSQGDPEEHPFQLPSSKHRQSPFADRLYICSAHTDIESLNTGVDEGLRAFQGGSLFGGSGAGILGHERTVKVVLGQGIRLPSGHLIRFGASLQDIYTDVGTPDRLTIKDIDIVKVMSQHRPYLSTNGRQQNKFFDYSSFGMDGSSEVFYGRSGDDDENNVEDEESQIEPDNIAPDYFCNYFTQGFDLVMCGVGHRLKKVVIHTNIPGHEEFGVYKRCLFEMPIPSVKSGIENGTSEEATSSESMNKCTKSGGKLPNPQTVEKTTDPGKQNNFSLDTNKIGSVAPSSPKLSVNVVTVSTLWSDLIKYLGPHPPPPPLLVNSDQLTDSGSIIIRKFYGYPGVIFEVHSREFLASITIFPLTYNKQ